jgi:hypothetical protein
MTARLLALFAAACLAAAPAAAPAQTYAFADGGLKDLNTGLIWDGSIATIAHTAANWTYANTYAANYTVTIGGVTYDDWRLPTLAEMQQATANPDLMTELFDRWNPEGSLDGAVYTESANLYFTSTVAKGSDYYAVPITIGMWFQPGSNVPVKTVFVSAGTPEATNKSFSYRDAFMVRPTVTTKKPRK